VSQATTSRRPPPQAPLGRPPAARVARRLGWKLLSLPALGLALLAGILLSGHDGSDFDRRVPVGPGGSLRVDIALGGGISFDHGSLHVRSHDAGDVRVLADSDGWGKYAVDLNLSHEGNAVALVGRVDGPLDWMFGGPTVDVAVWVPRDFRVDAHLDGGPLVLEDLAGPVTARVGDTDVTLHRAEGRVRVESDRGAIEVEDVDGALEVASGRGDVQIAGVRGPLSVRSDRGSVEVASVTGSVSVATRRGSVSIDGARGDVAADVEWGRIEAEEIEGDVAARTGRGGIRLRDVDGAVRAHSDRGSIEVRFEGSPRGDIETTRGSIEVEVPKGAGFDLDARTDRGRVRLGDDAGEFGDAADGSVAGEDDEGFGPFRRRDDALARPVNGGGEPLRLRSGRGSIRVRD